MSSDKHQGPGRYETILDKRTKFTSFLIDQKNTVVAQILFLKLFTFVYIITLTSIYIQIPGLYGRDGLLPINSSLDKIESHYGSNKYNVMPTIFWLSKGINSYLIQVFPSIEPYQAEENVFHLLCLTNIFIAFLVLFDKNPNIQNGSLFTDQISLVSRELLKWLAFRYTLTNGVLKISDSDQTSWSAISLQNYFQAQPLPSPLSKMFYNLPVSVHK